MQMKGERQLSSAAKATATVLLLLLLTACSSMDGSRLARKAGARLDKVDRYYAEMEAQVYSGEGAQTYQIRQWVENDGRWRVEVESREASQFFICDGRQIYVYQPDLGDYYRLDADDTYDVEPPFHLAGYLHHLLVAEEIRYEGEQKAEEQNCYTVSLPGWQRDETVRLWLDRKTLFPVVMETWLDEELLSRVVCRKLDLKPKVDDELFLFTPPGEGEVASHCLISPLTLDEAQSQWPHPVYVPQYLPPATFLFVISRGEEHGRDHLLFIYKGDHPFTLIQAPGNGTVPFRAENTRDVEISGVTGHYHANRSGELSTLWWSNHTTTFILTGAMPLAEMKKIAASLQSDE
jgi:outer membrane lipoprotein-sorting protein